MTDNFEHALEKENRRLSAEVERLTLELTAAVKQLDVAGECVREHMRQRDEALQSGRDEAAKAWDMWRGEKTRLEAEVERLTRERDEERKRADLIDGARDHAMRMYDEQVARAEQAERELAAARESAADWKTCAERELKRVEATEADRDEALCRAEAAEARSWVQCTTVSNECLGGCRSMREHDTYVNGVLLSELESLRPMVALHEDMTRLKREAEARAEAAEAQCAEAGENIAKWANELSETQNALHKEKQRAEAAEADNAALHERVAVIERELYLEHFETAHRMAGDLVREQHPGAALLERLRAAEKVVETLLEEMHDEDEPTKVSYKTYEALAAYDAAKEGV